MALLWWVRLDQWVAGWLFAPDVGMRHDEGGLVLPVGDGFFDLVHHVLEQRRLLHAAWRQEGEGGRVGKVSQVPTAW